MFLACYFHCSFFWSLDASSLVPLLYNFVNWESTGKLFKIRIICGISVNNFASSFDLLTHPIGKLFKIQIICRISFDNFANSFDLSTHPIWKLFKIRIICGISFNNFCKLFWSLDTSYWKIIQDLNNLRAWTWWMMTPFLGELCNVLGN